MTVLKGLFPLRRRTRETISNSFMFRLNIKECRATRNQANMNWFQQKSKIGNLYAKLSIAFPNEFTKKQRSQGKLEPVPNTVQTAELLACFLVCLLPHFGSNNRYNFKRKLYILNECGFSAVWIGYIRIEFVLYTSLNL